MTSTTLKPMPLWASILHFGIPSTLMTLGIYVGIPILDRAAVPMLLNFFLFSAGPLALMLFAALVAYRLEGNTLSWAGLRERFRLRPLKGKDWLWTVGLVVVAVGGYLALLPTAKWLASMPAFAPPDFLPPMVDPRAAEMGIPTNLFGVPLLGQWWIPVGYFVVSQHLWRRVLVAWLHPAASGISPRGMDLADPRAAMDPVTCVLEVEPDRASGADPVDFVRLLQAQEHHTWHHRSLGRERAGIGRHRAGGLGNHCLRGDGNGLL